MPVGWGLVAVQRVAGCVRASASLGRGRPRLDAACTHKSNCHHNPEKVGGGEGGGRACSTQNEVAVYM